MDEEVWESGYQRIKDYEKMDMSGRYNWVDQEN